MKVRRTIVGAGLVPSRRQGSRYVLHGRPRTHPSTAPGPAPGFILAATLWALVALTIVAAYIDGFTETNIDNAHRTKLMLEAELNRRSTEATLLYLLATNRMSPRSLLIEYEQRFSDLDTRLDDDADSELSVAGVRYAGLGDTAFSIQDENGLVSVNSPRDPMLGAMLKNIGLSEPDLARLIPRIADYVDRDDRLSLDGAETQAYLDAQQPPPSNWFLQTPMELNRVLGAADLIDHDQWRRLRNMATPRLLVSVNFNTMPEDVVAAVMDVERDALAGFFAERAQNRITSVDQLRQLTGGRPAFHPGTMAATPSYFLRLTTWWVGGGPRTVVGITLTPGSLIAPWRTEYRYSEPVDGTASLEQTRIPLLGGTAPDQA